MSRRRLSRQGRYFRHHSKRTRAKIGKSTDSTVLDVTLRAQEGQRTALDGPGYIGGSDGGEGGGGEGGGEGGGGEGGGEGGGGEGGGEVVSGSSEWE